MLLQLAAGAAAALAAWHLYRQTRPVKGDPPCPGSYPIIGSFRHLGRPPLYRFLSDEFPDADVVLLFLGSTRLYVLNSWTAFKEAMVDNADALSGRTSQKAVAEIFGDYGGLVNSEGDLWRSYRRFTLQTLRDFGLGRRGAEHSISAEVADLCSELARCQAESVDTAPLLARNVSNVICQLVFGSRLASESPEFHRILDSVFKFTANPEMHEANLRGLAYLPITERFTFMLHILMKLPGAKKMLKVMFDLMDFCEAQVQQHVKDQQEGAEARDYIDAHLKHQQQQQNAGTFNSRRLTFAILDLFIAGTETTANTMRWAVLFLIANPEAAEKVHREILDVVGDQRQPTMADKQQMHYTMATIEEVNRLASLVPLGVLHRVTQEATVTGYTLPADTFVLFNTHHIHRDPKEFPEPEAFRPERHLDEDGHFRPCQRLTTFGAGRRACLGESLARTELFLFFSGLVQRFRFELDADSCEGATAQQLLEGRGQWRNTLIRALPSHRVFVREW